MAMVWRPNHNGIITEAQAVPDGKNMSVLWKVRMLGIGHSGPAVVGDDLKVHLPRLAARLAGMRPRRSKRWLPRPGRRSLRFKGLSRYNHKGKQRF